jgi:DNA-binding FrmR family transcriptional regulator
MRRTKQDSEDKVLVRLKKIEGQIKGITKMYEESRGCSDIVQQIIAVKSALSRVGSKILIDESVRCARAPGKKKELNKALQELLDIV